MILTISDKSGEEVANVNLMEGYTFSFQESYGRQPEEPIPSKLEDVSLERLLVLTPSLLESGVNVSNILRGILKYKSTGQVDFGIVSEALKAISAVPNKGTDILKAVYGLYKRHRASKKQNKASSKVKVPSKVEVPEKPFASDWNELSKMDYSDMTATNHLGLAFRSQRDQVIQDIPVMPESDMRITGWSKGGIRFTTPTLHQKGKTAFVILAYSESQLIGAEDASHGANSKIKKHYKEADRVLVIFTDHTRWRPTGRTLLNVV